MPMEQQETARRYQSAGLTERDIERLRSLAGLIASSADRLTAVFFDHLAKHDEARGLFANRRALDEAKQRKHEHLLAMAGGEYGDTYIAQRAGLGTLYSRVGLDARLFLSAFRELLAALGSEIMAQTDNPAEAFESYLSIQKLSFVDIGIIVDVLISERESTIAAQQEAIRELSTPVLQLRERLLILPLIGVVDSQRAKQLTDNLLQAIRINRARVVVMDITGVAAVDSKVANHFLQTVAAARLMGATVIVSGLSPEVAQALVALGVDLSSLNTVGDLQGGLDEAERLLGYRTSLMPSVQNGRAAG